MEDDVVDYWGKLPANKTVKFAPDAFKDGDLLMVVYKYLNPNDLSKGGKNYQAMQSYFLREFRKEINIGDVVYEGTMTIYHSSESALPGIWIHNQLLFPLNIYYGGHLVSQIGAYDGMNYLGGSRASIWFDNQRQGLAFDAPITLAYSLPESEGTSEFLFSVFLYDAKMKNMIVGVINGNPDGPPPGNAVYSIDEPVYTGITYYIPIGNGKSRATNPYAPF
uniref:Uncharacterized protein n=1 Tax=Marseillevirus LCMAC101 TaxID=2506602 RepID=A0A481YQJ1_9VIRU|nr:MAG: hypothetical protein LCMAC101_00350 [Marseillevirus LCMAC101]